MSKLTFRLVPVITAIIIFSGCRGSGRLSEFEQKSVSPEGIRAEDFLPEDIFIVGEINRSDTQQEAQFKKLTSYFPTSVSENPLMARLLGSFDEYLQTLNLSYEKDVKPIINATSRIVIAGKFTDPNGQNKETYISLGLRDPSAYDQLINKIISENQNTSLVAVDYNGNKLLFDNQSNIFITRFKDLVVAGLGLDQGKAVIDRFNNGKNNLSSSQKYKDVVAKLPANHLGFLYIDVQNTLRSARELNKQNPEQTNQNILGEKIPGEGFVIIAENNGLRLQGYVLGDKKSDLNLKDFSGPRTIYKVTPITQLIGYFEGYDLEKFFLNNIKGATAVNPDFAKSYTNLQNKIKQITQLDLEQDILSWMDQNYSLVIQNNNGSILPGLSLFIKSSDSKKTKDFSRIMTAQLRGVLPFIQSFSAQVANALTEDEVPVGDAKLSRLTIDFKKLSASTEEQLITVPPALQNDKITIQYGVTDDDNFVISTYHNLAADYNQGGLNDDTEFEKVNDKIADYQDGLVFINPNNLVEYIKIIMSLSAEIRGVPMTAEDKKNMELIEGYLKPIKSIIIGGKLEEKSGELSGYIRIGQ